jgi:MFS family permease
MGGFFALAGTGSINDVFFVHERGTRVGLWNLGVITSVNLTPVISGYVISDLSWRWSFWLEAIMFGIVLLATFFLFPETTFDRAALLALQLENEPLDDKPNQVSVVSETMTETSGLRWRSVLGIEAVKVPELKSFLTSFFAPFALIPHPIVIYGSLMWAVTFTWTILLGAVVSQIFTPSPYNMDTIAVGNLSGVAPFIGSALGTVTAGWFCDFSATYLAKKNHGTYEPEFRLLVIFPAAIAMAIGSFGLGAAIHNGISAFVCGVFMAIINFAVGLGCTGIVSYTNDACGEKASDAFGIAMVSISPLTLFIEY